jgi:hypothetical protein
LPAQHDSSGAHPPLSWQTRSPLGVQNGVVGPLSASASASAPPLDESVPASMVPSMAASRSGPALIAPPSSTPPSGSAPGWLQEPPEQRVSESKQSPLLQVENASHGTLAQSGSIVMGSTSGV